MKITRIQNAISASAIIGVNAGYHHQNEVGINTMWIAEVVKKLAEKVESETGIYISGAIYETRTCYKEEWGCPVGGEATFKLEADCNPTYSDLPANDYITSWKGAFVWLVQLLMEQFGQTTVTIKTGDEVYYLDRHDETE